MLSPCLSPVKSSGIVKYAGFNGKSRKASFSPIPLSIEFNDCQSNPSDTLVPDSC